MIKNNIDSDSIQNRKFVIEVRFVANPKILDERGELINALVDSNIIKNPTWELGSSAIKISDNKEKGEERKFIYIDTNRISFISSGSDTNSSYFSSFSTAYKIFKDKIKNIKITRVGVRIQGTYLCKSNRYEDILGNFTRHFPSQFLFKDFPSKDLLFQLTYQNGNYSIGPISKDDIFIKNEFKCQNRKEHVGFAIDTDNYILNDELASIDIPRIKEVFITSLSVEKLLFDELKSL